MKKKKKNISAKVYPICYNVLDKKEVIFLEVTVHMNLQKEEESFLSKDDLSGYLENNKLSFTYDNMEHTIIFTKDQILFKRENNEYCFELMIKEEATCTFLLKETNTLLDIHVESANFIIGDHKIEIDYCIETDDVRNTVVVTWQEREG